MAENYIVRVSLAGREEDVLKGAKILKEKVAPADTYRRRPAPYKGTAHTLPAHTIARGYIVERLGDKMSETKAEGLATTFMEKCKAANLQCSYEAAVQQMES